MIQSKVIILCLINFFVFSSEKMIGSQNVKLLQKPTFLAKRIKTLTYGQKVRFLESKGSWSKVSHGNTTGWLHNSTLATNKNILNEIGKGAKVSKVSGEDVTLAGKGFSKEHEGHLKKNNKNLKFSDVDRLEKMKVSASALRSFVKSGGLKLGGE